MAGYLGTKAVLLSTTAADVVGNAEIGGDLTVGGAFTSQGIDDNASATAMTLDASGNVGIGTSSVDYTAANRTVVHIEGSSGALLAMEDTGAKSYFFQSGNDLLLENDTSTGSMIFGTNSSTERMRIDASGNLLVGTTSRLQNEKFGVSSDSEAAYFQNSASGNGTVTAKATNASYADWVYTASTNRGSGTSCGFFRGVANSLFTIFIYNNGNIVNLNNSYGAISDVRLKENITDATPKLDKLNQVRVVNYNLIGQDQKQIGVIAQEIEQIFPSMVEETIDRDAEGTDLGTTTKSVKYSVFVPMLIKAMQEQQAIIDALETRLAALEGK